MLSTRHSSGPLANTGSGWFRQLLLNKSRTVPKLRSQWHKQEQAPREVPEVWNERTLFSGSPHHRAWVHQPSPHIQAVIAIMGHRPLDNAQPKYNVLRSKIKI